MEWKIGEIKQLNGEWYQCVEHKGCHSCAFTLSHGTRCGFNGDPHCTYRSDGKFAIFKKLEKVGEPIIYMSRAFQRLKSPDTKQCKYCYFRNQVCNPQLCGEELFLVEIKIKENMEEKKLNLKPFNLEKAKQGNPVCTRDGRNVRIVCFDAKCDLPIIALVTDMGGNESLIRYYSNGSFTNLSETSYDLMMLPEKKVGWVNVYKNQIHDTPESAEEGHKGITDYIKTIRVEWEE